MFVLDFNSNFLFNRNVIFYITYSRAYGGPRGVLPSATAARNWKWKNIAHALKFGLPFQP